ncbi:MAG: heme exporter protein CcmB [Nitrospinota bacterium]|jgi:heme exporter protein CcmB|nr:heme exporter protein CcmB [Nitrospinota bacterium]HJM41957.1 heme exporter protein CcmB [Nitrospinota bacterium]
MSLSSRPAEAAGEENRPARDVCPAPDARLSTRGLTRRFGPLAAVEDVDISLPAGCCLSVFGFNGAGKTTLLKMLSLLSRPTAGRIWVDGEEAARGAAVRSLRRRMGFLSHQPLLYGHLSPRENLSFYGRLYGVPRVRERTEEVLAFVGLADRADDPVRGFSRGMTQRASIGRALVHDPDILFLDEPFTGLDRPGARMLMDTLGRLRDEGKTLVLTTHDLEIGLALCDEVAILDRGRVRFASPRSGVDAGGFAALYESRTGRGGGGKGRRTFAVDGMRSMREGPRRAGSADTPAGGLREYFTHAAAVLWKDLLSECRSREAIVTMAIFALLVMVLFNFAFELGERWKASVGSGILWTAFLFSSVLGMNRAFALEKEGECIQGILLSPADRGSIFVGKLAGNLVFLWIVEAVSLPVFGVLYDFPLDRLFLVLGPVVILATIGLATVGTLFASIAVNTKAREVMLPLLLFPVAIPIVIGAAGATTGILAGGSPADQAVWYRLLGVYDVVFLVISIWVVDYALEE